ncbi:CDC48 family AAA ATPase [uncultured Methanobrevibacter sp.]|uniref:CDC48 family AAA ATPase n=1 Tax=uncultured Methanobrevibacter sp. TaxID=253161 RepID=UPI0025EED686|nr:CDC48 family AAA ATPase [uncultured Methanobrevibacter sp.]
MVDDNIKTPTLKVAEALSQRDIGQGIVRIDPNAMGELGLEEGDLIEIKGSKTTAATVVSSQSDIGLGIIRMDGTIRKNSGASIGEEIEVKKASVKIAKKVVLAPTENNVKIQGDIRGLFLNKVMTKGDIVGSGIKPPMMQNQGGNPFDDMFNNFMDISPMGELKFAVVSTHPTGVVKVGPNTQIDLQDHPVDISKLEGVTNLVNVSYEDIGGLKEEVRKVREMIEIPLKRPELFERLGIAPPKGVLMHGPPGTGKTLLAKAVASESDAHFISINGPEIMSKYVGGSEENLREFFEEAEANAPSIIFIDELDAIAPKREETQGEVERRTVAQLLTLMDGLNSRGQVVVIGATNRPDSLDQALRRPGRFDREIEIGVPDREERREIMEIHTRTMPLSKDVELDKIAESTHGFVGADLESLCKEAAMRVVRRIIPEINKSDEEIPEETLKKIIVNNADFKEALKEIQPSALREVLVQIPDIKWSDIGGLETAKQELQEAIEWPLKYPDKFKKFHVEPPRGILLYGDPGTGKTLLAKAVASESDANFIAIKGPELLSKWVGESEKGVREVFRKARQTAPTVIFFDEIDSIANTRGDSGSSNVTQRVVNQLLTEIDGMEDLHDVAIIAATNRPDIIDPGLMRPGRFDRHIKVETPDEESRLKIFEVHTNEMPLADNVKLSKLAKRTEGYVGADIEAVCREAAMLTLRESMDAEKVDMSAFNEAMEKVKPNAFKQSQDEMVQYL